MARPAKNAQLEGRVAVVTGAAHGIGRATALALAAEGARLELVDIDAAALEASAARCARAGASGVSAHALDVAEREAIQRLAADITERTGAAHILVNAAGVAILGGFLELAPDDWEWLFRVNWWGAVNTSAAFLPTMIAQGRGHVVNVASASAFFAPAGLSAYASGKAALVSLSQALREELAPTGVRVTAVCPGFVDTALLDRARLRGVYAGSRDAIARETTGRGIPADRVARAILDALANDRALVPVGADAWALYLLKRLTPAALPGLVRFWTRWAASK